MTRYFRHLFLYFVAILSIMAVAGYVLDPYGYFRSRGVRSSWLLQDRVWGEARVAKALTLPGLKPQTLIAGTSRVWNGFDVSDPELKRYTGDAYNLGLRGASFDELDRYIRGAMAAHTPRTLVLGIDMGEFTRPADNGRSDSSALAAGGLRPAVRRLAMALWSRSVFTAHHDATSGRPHVMSLDGGRNLRSRSKDYRKYGHRALTRKVEAKLAMLIGRHNLDLYLWRMKALGDLLGEACRRGVDSKLFISPMHVRQLLLLRAIGRWESFMRWKADVSAVVDDAKAQGCSVSLTDFSRLSPFTSEPVPEEGDTLSAMQWYWESSHYKPALGLRVIQRLWGQPLPHARDFGRDLSADEAQSAIVEATAELERFRRAHPELDREIREIVSGRLLKAREGDEDALDID